MHSGILPQSLCVCSGVFPEPDVDPVIQIASMVQRQGEKEPFIRTVFTLQSCASIVGSQILCFTQEKQLLQVHHHILCRDTHTHTCSVNRLASHGLGALFLACLLSLSLSQSWAEFVRTVDPDIITGYNIQNFDLPYLINRAAALKVRFHAVCVCARYCRPSNRSGSLQKILTFVCVRV